jgi:biotin synthase
MQNLSTADKTIKEDLYSPKQLKEILALFELPFNDLLFKAQQIHRENFKPNEVQVSSLLSIKTASCPEDCKYCPQSAHNKTAIVKADFIDVSEVVKNAQAAKEQGATRFCMGAAWRQLHDRDLDKVCDMVKAVKDLGLESCVTLGMLDKAQSTKLKEAGLDYYNHNLDTSREYYKEIITTRTYDDRLNTLKNIKEAGLKTCSGGIVGMGETRIDRAKMLATLAGLDKQPESVPINRLVKVPGTPLANVDDIDDFEFIRTIAIARIILKKSYVRLSAGREEMSDETQALCFFAGANSIFYGEKLLTQSNPSVKKDLHLLKKLGIKLEA